MIGNVDLGSGVNAFNNLSNSTFQTLDYVKLGGGVLSNDGAITPGGLGVVQATAVNGSLKQSATGIIFADLDLNRTELSGEIDSLTFTEAADVQGTFVLNVLNPAHITPGDHTASIIHANGLLSASNLSLMNAPDSAVATFTLKPTDHDLSLNYVVDFSPEGFVLTGNQGAVADYVSAILAAGETAQFAPIAKHIFSISNVEDLAAYYTQLVSEPMLSPLVSNLFAGDFLNGAMLSCRMQDGGSFRFLDEGQCTWFQASPRRIERELSTGLSSDEDLTTVSAGSQVVVTNNLRLGVSLGYQNSSLEVGNALRSNGNRGMAGLSMKYVSDPILAALTLTGGFGTTDSARFVAGAIATSRQETKFASSQFRLATQLVRENFYIRPLVDVAGGAAWLDGFQEQGAGPLSLIVDDTCYTYATVTPAIEVGGEIAVYGTSVVCPFARIGMTQFLTGNRQAIAASFAGAPAGVSPFINTTTLDSTLATIDVGVDLLNAGRTAARIDYSFQYGERTKAHGLTLKLSTSW